MSEPPFKDPTRADTHRLASLVVLVFLLIAAAVVVVATVSALQSLRTVELHGDVGPVAEAVPGGVVRG